MKVRILNQCPDCKRRIPHTRPQCLCGRFLDSYDLYLDFYVPGRNRRKRLHIGGSLKAAQYQARKIQNLADENKFIPCDVFANVSLTGLCDWYLKLPLTTSKKSYKRIKNAVDNFLKALPGNENCTRLNHGHLDSYRAIRGVSPATMRLELTILKSIYKKALEHNKLTQNPIAAYKLPSIDNERDRVLAPQEFEDLYQACDDNFRRIVLVAYLTGMRKEEILGLPWDEVDLSNWVIKLKAERTKSNKARTVPIHHPRLQAMFSSIPRAIHTNLVFLCDGKPYKDPKHRFHYACKKIGLEDFRFHDLRHCAVNNFRKAGIDEVAIKAIVGHSSNKMYERYCTVTTDEINNIKWLEGIPNDEHSGKRMAG